MTGNPRQALLSENREELTVGGLAVNEAAYIVPWGMWIDAKRRCWLHPDYTVRASPHGTVCMRIERREDGYHVWPPSDATWQPQENPSYASPTDTAYIPVSEFHDTHQAR